MSGPPAGERVHIRPADEEDARVIHRIIRQARISPLDIDWRKFAVAESAGQIVGIGQIREYRDGTRELASLAVIPEWQNQGIASLLVGALLQGELGELFLICQDGLEGFYRRFGFSTVDSVDHPTRLGRYLRLGNLFFNLTEKIGAEKIRLIIMRRKPEVTHE